MDQAAEVTHAPAVETAVNEDGSVSVTIPMVGNATAMSFAISSKPTHGTVTGTGPQFLYHPGSDFSGKDSFRVTATEMATKKQTIVPVFIGIGAVNDPPSAHDDQFTTAEDTNLVIPTSAVMANDVDVDSKLTVVSVTQPEAPGICAARFGCSHTSVTLDGDQITYHPYHNFNGTQTFTYTVSDGEYTSTANVAVRVTATNDAPYGFVLNASVADDTSYTISTADLADYSSDPDGDTTFVSGVSNAAGGTVTMADDVVTFVPTKVVETGEAGFDFTVSDGQLTGTGHVYLYVSHVNHAPIAQDDDLSVDQDTTLPIAPSDVFGNDSDPDGDTFTLVGYTQPPHGHFYGSVANAYYVPNEGYVGDDSFEYTISDGSLTSTAVVHIDVKHVNHAPTATAGDLTVDENGSANVTLTGNDPDSDELTYAVVTQPEFGTVTVVGSTATYTPNGDYSGEDAFQFTVSDGTLTSEPAKVHVTVTSSANEPPLPDSLYAANNGNHPGCSAFDADFTVHATDPDSTNLTYTYVRTDRFTLTTPPPSTVTQTGPATFHYHLDGYCSISWDVEDEIVWQVEDDHGNKATAIVEFGSSYVD